MLDFIEVTNKVLVQTSNNNVVQCKCLYITTKYATSCNTCSERCFALLYFVVLEIKSLDREALRYISIPFLKILF